MRHLETCSHVLVPGQILGHCDPIPAYLLFNPDKNEPRFHNVISSFEVDQETEMPAGYNFIKPSFHCPMKYLQMYLSSIKQVFQRQHWPFSSDPCHIVTTAVACFILLKMCMYLRTLQAFLSSH